MKCFRCLLRVAEDRSAAFRPMFRDAITVYNGTALCELCAIAAAEADKQADHESKKKKVLAKN